MRQIIVKGNQTGATIFNNQQQRQRTKAKGVRTVDGDANRNMRAKNLVIRINLMNYDQKRCRKSKSSKSRRVERDVFKTAATNEGP